MSCARAFVAGAALVAALGSGAPAVAQRRGLYADFVIASARPRDAAEVARLWAGAEFVLSPHDPQIVAHELVVTRATLARLRGAGLRVTATSGSVQRLVDESYARNDAVAGPGVAVTGFFDKVQPLDVIDAQLDELAAASAGRARVVVIGKSIEGRDLRALKLAARNQTGRASVIVTGAQHAREWLSPMVVMGIADGLVTRYESDARVRAVVDALDVYVVPVMNPDGYLRTFDGNRLQRKNLRPTCNVDINRNFATAFGQMVTNNCRSETTSGPAAFSEPESQALKALAEQLPRLRLYLDYHSSGNQVMIPYAYTREAPPNLAKNQALGELLAREAQLPARPGFNLAQGQGGGSLDWFREKFTDSLVVELPGRGFDPPAAGVAASVEIQWKGFLAVAEVVARENAAGDGDAGVTDADSGGAGGDASGGAGGASGGAPGATSDDDAGRAGAGGSRAMAGAGASGGTPLAGAGGSGGVEVPARGSPVPTDADAFAGGCGVARAPGGGVVPAALALLAVLLRRRRAR
jgi:hypothetical protein